MRAALSIRLFFHIVAPLFLSHSRMCLLSTPTNFCSKKVETCRNLCEMASSANSTEEDGKAKTNAPEDAHAVR
jgi:hypothetical protein